MRPRPLLDSKQKRPASVTEQNKQTNNQTNKTKQTNYKPKVDLVTLIFFFCFLGDQMQIGNEAEATRNEAKEAS